jgi:hypothetical protein
MTIDRTTKAILIAIALGLFANAATPLVRPTTAHAQTGSHCTGTLHVNAWGATEPSIGGYNIDVNCN